jgi:aminopeptidase N
MAASLRSLVESAAPGSDHQLAYARALATVASSPEDLALLSGLLDGSAVIEGLAVDTDLRWILLRRLVSQGVAGDAAIDAEFAADSTDAGERHAATCRAAIPTAEAKRDTWEELTSGKLTIAMFRAVLLGFADPDGEELLRQYAPSYFEAISGVWRDWSSAMAQDFVSGAYVVCPVSQETVTATDGYIAASAPPAALHRLLIEGRDEVLRSLRCQARDREA